MNLLIAIVLMGFGAFCMWLYMKGKSTKANPPSGGGGSPFDSDDRLNKREK